MFKKCRVSRRSVYSFLYLYSVCEDSLEEAEKQGEGRFYNCLVAMLFAAFSLEAYLNYLGKRTVPFWSEIEYNKPEEKLKIILCIIDLRLDGESFKTFKEIFRFRNVVVHAKTKSFDYNRKPIYKEEWDRDVNLKNTEKFCKSTKKIISNLHKKASEEFEELESLENLWAILEVGDFNNKINVSKCKGE